MSSYHVAIALKSDPRGLIIRLDMDAEELEQVVRIPFNRGQTIVVDGQMAAIADIREIRIRRTDERSDDLAPRIKEEERARIEADARAGIYYLHARPFWELVFERGQDVTNEYIVGSPGSKYEADGKAPLGPQTGSNTGEPRANLIPAGCRLAIRDSRLQGIAHELRTLNLEEHPNAIAVLLRVFLELSADVYMCETEGTRGNSGLQASLGKKVRDVTDSLVTSGKLSEAQAQPARSATHKNSFLTPSVPRMHQWVHNRYMPPGPSDLRNEWDNLQPWFEAVWA